MTTKLKRAAFGLRKIRASRGGWAIEATGALSLLVMLIGFGMYNESRSNNRRMAEIAATHYKAVTTAASAYVKDHYSDLLAAAPAVGATTTVSFVTLKNAGYLQPTLSSTDIWGQEINLRVRRSSTDPKQVQLEGLVIGEGGQAVPHDMAREVSQNIGAEGGYTVATDDYCGTTKVAENTLCGTRGVWSRPVADFGASGAPGHIVSALFFKDGMAVNDYLYRHRVPGKPELNTMETYLQMGTGAHAVEGQPCYSVAGDATSPLLANVAIATTAEGIILSCQDDVWGKQIKPKPLTQTYFWLESFGQESKTRYCPPGFFAVSSNAIIIPSGTLSCSTTIFNTDMDSGSVYPGCNHNLAAPGDTGYRHQLVCSRFH